VKIAIIANGFQVDYTLNLINALDKQEVRINFIGSNIYQVSKINGDIKFYNVRREDWTERNPFKKAGWVLHYFAWYFAYLVKEKRNIIHIQWLRFNFFDGIFFSLIARLLGHKVVYTAHDVIPHDNDTPLNRLLFRFIYHSQNFIIVHTNYIKTRIQKEFGIKPGKISVIHHGVYRLNYELKIDPESYKKDLGIQKDEYVVLFFGIITKYKGLDLLAEALATVRKKSDIAVRLIIAGRIQNGFEPEMNYIKNNSFKEGVDYFLRFIEEEEIRKFFGSADLTELPYREASQSGVMFMSYAHGVLVVAPDLGGFPDDVVPGNTGLLFEAGNTESLSESILSAISTWGINNSGHKKEITNFAAEKYQLKESPAELLKVYKQLINQ
jgi:glycosyltransferase involved in cell wall biosynthesis